MLFPRTGLAAVATVTVCCNAAAQSTTYVESGVPTGVPIPGDYTGALRPQIHFSPPQHFMNDPNGMFLDANGTWHLYYQCKTDHVAPLPHLGPVTDPNPLNADNPTDIVAGNQHWGHATSQDLYHWVNQPIAIYPSAPDEGIFSGSAVIDVNNTSGFFPDQDNGVVAIYTLNTPTAEVQEIAYSRDGGFTFTRYAGNPVLTDNSTQFRDPKLIRYGDYWVMVVAYAQDLTIGIFTSPNLKHWTHASNFSHHGLLGLQYECPNLVAIPSNSDSSEQSYVLMISINPGAPLGGSISQYFPGTFNGTHFVPYDSATRLLDFGKDNYAGQFFYGTPVDEPPVFLGWASNWQYAQMVPTGPLEDWRSSMTLPKQMTLSNNVTRIGYDLIIEPYGLDAVYDSVLARNESLGNGSVLLDYSMVGSGAIYFQVNVSNIPNNTLAQGTLNFTFSSAVTKEYIGGGFFFGGDTPFWLNRGGIRGFDNPFFTDKFSTNNIIGSDGTFMLEGVVDRTLLEIWLDGGVRSATSSFYPIESLDTLQVAAGGLNEGVTVSVLVRSLQSAWAAMAVNETVSGNVSMVANGTQVMPRRSALPLW